MTAMKIPDSLIKILRCPENHQSLSMAEPDTLLELNQRIAANQLKNHGGTLVEAVIEAGLVREDRKRLYPVIDGFPVMLVDEAIDMA